MEDNIELLEYYKEYHKIINENSLNMQLMLLYNIDNIEEHIHLWILNNIINVYGLEQYLYYINNIDKTNINQYVKSLVTIYDN